MRLQKGLVLEMEKNAQERKAEDILTNDQAVEELQGNNESGGNLNDYQYELASQIHHAVNEKKEPLSLSQKEELGERITRTINFYKRRALIVRISAAAVFLLLIGISALLRTNRESELKTFAHNSKSVSSDGNTKLILSGQEEIQINTTESKIEYEANGNHIHVNSSDSITQAVSDREMVYNTVIVPYGKRTRITLSDNSSIWLNSGSKLIYPAKFADNVREVYLEGEAIFEVNHNKEQPFQVITRNVEIKVLGTVFDVCAYDDDATTSTILEKGSVELKYNSNSILSKDKVTMVPGTLATFDPTEQVMKQSKVNTHLYTSWREGYFVFEKQSLDKILKKISRYYDVSILLNDQSLENETFTGSLDLRNSVVPVLEAIGEIINARVEKKEDKILITRIE